MVSKRQFIAYFKKQLNLSKTGGIWWNPKWGNMEDYFTEEEMKTLRVSVRNILGKEDARFSAHVPWEQREKYAEERSMASCLAPNLSANGKGCEI